MELKVEPTPKCTIKPKGCAQFSLVVEGIDDPRPLRYTVQSKSRALESRWVKLEVPRPNGESTSATLRVQADEEEELPPGKHPIRVEVRNEQRPLVRSTAIVVVEVRKVCVFMPDPPSFSIDSSGQVSVSIKLVSCGDLDVEVTVEIYRLGTKTRLGSDKVGLRHRTVTREIKLVAGPAGLVSVLDGAVEILAEGQLLQVEDRRLRTKLRRLSRWKVPPLMGLIVSLVTLAVLLGYLITSNTSGTSTQPLTATAPSALSASAGDQLVTLSWTAPGSAGSDPVTRYDIYEATDPTMNNRALVGVVPAGRRSFTVAGLNDGTTYFFSVSALSSAGPSPRSNEAYAVPFATSPPPTVPTTIPKHVTHNGTTPPAKKLSAPLGLTAHPTRSEGVITLTWTAPSTNGGGAITGYDIYWAVAATGLPSSPTASIVSPAPTSYTVRTLTRNVQFAFAVTAVDGTVQSPPSSSTEAELYTPQLRAG